MPNITKAKPQDAKILAQIAKDSFLPAHGHSASKEDIDNYVSENFNEAKFIEEISNPNNHYYIIYEANKIAGYSKIMLNTPNTNIDVQNITCLSRLYILKEFYDKNLGKQLFNFMMELSKQHKQIGVWLYVWIENHRAINFYTKMGFKIVGAHNFKISETHSNPNHVMYLNF